jgi:hypothetical protein
MELGELPQFIPGALRQFETVRSQILQNGNVTSTSDVISAIDSGLSLLKILYALPIERNVVYSPGVPIYSDASCVTLITDAKGLILETTSPGGGHKVFRIFPTTRTDYVKDEAVSWEWNMSKIWKDAWYRDPDSNEIKLAWNSSAEFAGRDLEKLYPNSPLSNP